jgi:four helix bundle protein
MRRFKELEVWKLARRLSRSAYRLTSLPSLKGHFEIQNQVRRAAISIPANLAEGYGLGTRPQLVRCMRISLGSAYELETHLELIEDLGLAPPDQIGQALAECRQQIGLLIGTLRGLGS